MNAKFWKNACASILVIIAAGYSLWNMQVTHQNKPLEFTTVYQGVILGADNTITYVVPVRGTEYVAVFRDKYRGVDAVQALDVKYVPKKEHERRVYPQKTDTYQKQTRKVDSEFTYLFRGKPVLQLATPPGESVLYWPNSQIYKEAAGDVIFSPDGKNFVARTTDGNSSVIWNYATRKNLYTLTNLICVGWPTNHIVLGHVAADDVGDILVFVNVKTGALIPYQPQGERTQLNRLPAAFNQ